MEGLAGRFQFLGSLRDDAVMRADAEAICPMLKRLAPILSVPVNAEDRTLRQRTAWLQLGQPVLLRPLSV